MSHVVAVGPCLQEADLLELRRRVQEIGGTFLENKQRFTWFGRWVDDYHGNDAAFRHGVATGSYGTCAHAIALPGAKYEIGVVKTEKGYKLVYDNYGAGGLAAHSPAGQKALALSQGMSEYLVQKNAATAGFTISAKSVRADGQVEIRLAPSFKTSSGGTGKAF